MLVPIRRGTNMASHTKLCNFPRYIFSNNSIMRYRTALWLSHVVYVSLFYNISISWLYLLNGWGLYFFTCVTMCEVKTTNCFDFWSKGFPKKWFFSTVLTENTRQLSVVSWRKFHTLKTSCAQTFGSCGFWSFESWNYNSLSCVQHNGGEIVSYSLQC